MKKLILLLNITLICFTHLSANSGEPFLLTSIEDAPAIDGRLDEAIWDRALHFNHFSTMKPKPGMSPSEATDIMILANESHLYLGLRCYDSAPDGIKASMANRDRISNDDWISIEIDPFNNGQSCYLFKVNPFGIQADGMGVIFIDESGDYPADSLNFDTQWQSRGQLTKDGYIVEVAIPYSSLRFPAEKNVTIGLGVRRLITRHSEISTFPAFDPQKGSWMVQRQKILLPDIKFKHQLELIPAFTTGKTKMREHMENWKTTDRQSELSLSARYAVSPQLTLDATINPDFSQVEADAGQIDLNLRNALFFAEKRPFFLEGQDELSFVGNSSGFWQPVRRIVHTRTIENPMLGLKLTGKIGTKNSIYALMSIDDPNPSGFDAENTKALVGVLRSKRPLWQDSYLGGLFTTRSINERSNQVIGFDGRLRQGSGSRLEFQALASNTAFAKDEEQRQGVSLSMDQRFNSKAIMLNLGLRYTSSDFNTDLGMINRTGVFILPLDIRATIAPRSDFFKRIDFLCVSQQSRDLRAGLWETFNWIGLEVYLPNNSWLYFGGSPASEIYNEQRFNTSYLGAGLFLQLSKWLYVEWTGDFGRFIQYNPTDARPGHGKKMMFIMVIQPLNSLKLGSTIHYADLFDHEFNNKLFSAAIFRQSVTWQISRHLFMKTTAEYNTNNKQLTGNFLTSFTWIPGTVIQAGYGSVFDEIKTINHRPEPVLRQTHQTFFFKTSYLLKL